jgi:hypothetical protein
MIAGIAVLFIGVLVGAAMVGSGTASADPGQTRYCSCHAYPAATLRVSTNVVSPKTVAAGSSFVVNIAWSGGSSSGRTEINWPTNINSTTPSQNSLFNPTPRVPFSGTAASGTTSSTLTAPAAPGTYALRVYSSEAGETYYADMTVIVEAAAPTTYTITTSVSPASSGTVTGGGTVNSGSTVNLVATAASGYQFVNWTEGATVVGTSPSYSFAAAGNRTLVANFAVVQATTYTVTTSVSPASSGTVTGGGTVNSGATVNLVATAASGYQFVNWTEGATVVGTSPSYSFAAAGNRTLVANFAIETHTITPAAVTNGSISPAAGVAVNHGASQTFNITANTGYHVADVLVDGVSVGVVATSSAISSTTEVPATSYTFTNVTASHTISAVFAPHATVPGSDTAGPPSRELRFSSISRTLGSVTLRAVVDDTSTGGSNIAAAEYFLDAVGAPGTGKALSASDGSFSSITEAVRATVKVQGLASGTHTIYVRGQDAAGNWGATSSISFQLRTSRYLRAGEVRISMPGDDDDDDSSEGIVITVGTGRQHYYRDEREDD